MNAEQTPPAPKFPPAHLLASLIASHRRVMLNSFVEANRVAIAGANATSIGDSNTANECARQLERLAGVIRSRSLQCRAIRDTAKAVGATINPIVFDKPRKG